MGFRTVIRQGNDLKGEFATPPFFLFNKVFISMKKIIRLTESDLTRIVRRVIKENEEGMIRIPRKYNGVRMELGKSANPQDIIEMYNELVEEGTALVDYSEEGMFYNEDDQEIPTDVILDELNYAIVGEEEDYDEEDF